jgi:hypothetical protein
VDQIYFEDERNLKWPYVYSGKFNERDFVENFQYYTSDDIDLRRRDFLCYMLTYDKYLRLREPHESLKKLFSNEEWQLFTREFLRLSDDACEKLSKLEGIMEKNPYNGILTRFFRWQDRNIAKPCFGWLQQGPKMLKAHEKIPGPWNSCLRHFICIFSIPLIYLFLFLIFLPVGLLFAYTIIVRLVVSPVLGVIDLVSQNKGEGLKYLNEMSYSNPDLDMVKIEESLVSGINAIVDNLNHGKLRGSGIIAEPYFGVEYIPGADKEPGRYVNRYLILFKNHSAV